MKPGGMQYFRANISRLQVGISGCLAAVEFQSKEHFPISVYLKMLILATGCLTSTHPVVTENL